MRSLSVVASLLLLLFAASARADTTCARAAAADSAFRVEYFKADGRLCVVKGGEVLLSANASHGRAPGPKRVEGDHRTPEGRYRLSPARYSTKFGRFMLISYPSKADRERARALGKPAGGAIGIHGPQLWYAFLGSAQALVNHSDGCVVLDRTAMARLDALITEPVPIIIHGSGGRG